MGAVSFPFRTLRDTAEKGRWSGGLARGAGGVDA